LRDCIINDNSALLLGGGIYTLPLYNAESNPSLTNCVFTGNWAGISGGGVHTGCSPTFANCTFIGNSAGEGGGMLIYCGSDVKLTNCTFNRNSADFHGGGVAIGFDSNPSLTNCILYDNSDSNGMDESAQIYNIGPIKFHINYCCIQDWTGALGGIGNIGADPLFVDPNSNDYHLKSEGWRWDAKRKRWDYDDVTSRCIDAGNPGSPLEGELLSVPDDPNDIWGENIRIDMGAYGGTLEASMAPYDWALISDLTNDGIVNLKDFTAQAKYWLTTENKQPGDLNRNGTVDIADLALLAEDYLKETIWYKP